MTASFHLNSTPTPFLGDQAAAKALYHQYAPAMYNICLRMVQHPQEAEDLLQEAFIQVFEHLNRFRGESTLGAWIKSIVVNKCLNHLKKRRLPVVFEPVDDVAEPEATCDEDAFKGTVELIREAISQLPDGYRIVLSLYLFEGYSHRDIARFLNITESTAKTQYMRAKQKVRTWVIERQNNQ